ncbi:uncharacterized protein DMAD_11521 [Drosophila madeirensis]|uniref:Uncharacterized protein n=1 Tax=Drosophila madeirensis TaxID=30013 RepID=A0AAU9FDL0_DROMD
MEPRWTLFLLSLWLPLALALKQNKTTTQKSTPLAVETEKYYIKSSECRIWNSQQISKDTIADRTNIDYRECYQDDDLISTSFHDKYQRYMIHINDLLSQLIIDYNCSYREIQRGNKIEAKDVPFQDGYVVPPEVEGMIASCSNSLGEVLQTTALAFVQPRSSARKLPKSPKSQRLRPNVIMINIGSISRLNFRKNLPELSKYLQMEGWHEMQGYGRVAQGLIPNLMAILSGYSPHTWQNLECQAKKFGCLESLPLIWNHFKRRGYLTAYGEDMSYQSPFKYEKSRLDYYAKGIDTEMPNDCIGRLLNLRYVHEFWQLYLERHLTTKTQPLFGYFRTNSSSYDLFADGNILEPFLVDYLQRFIELGLFKHSIVMLLSDGGDLEDLLPLLFIWLPPWFRVEHPEAVQSLNTNSQRLTSPFDLHLTLQHILELGDRWPHAVPELQDCPKCQTLLAPMNESRSCPDVGISDATCPCDSYKPIDERKNKHLPLGALLVRGINDFLHHRNLQELCYNLTLKTVTAVSACVTKQQDSKSYRVTFSAQPSHPVFAGTLRYNHKLNELDYLNVGAIRRVNSYRKDSECMQKLTGKKFCVCRKPLKVNNLKAQMEKHSIKKKAVMEKLKLKQAKLTKKNIFRGKINR